MRSQSSLFVTSSKTAHGGDASRGRRKSRRPVVTKGRMHLVLRAERARGAWSLLHPRNARRIETTIARHARRQHVKVERYANVGNHLHLLVRVANRRGFQDFLRTITALIARTVTGARRSNPTGKFWDALAFTRCVTTPRDQRIVIDYINANKIEATHGQAAREDFLESRKRKPWRRTKR